MLALIVAWGCYGLIAITLADSEASRCHQFGDLAAECSTPLLLYLTGLSGLFVAATLTMAVIAIRSQPRLDGQ